MADKSLLAELLLSPSDVRKKEENERLARGQMNAAMMGQGMGGVGGMFAAFGAAQAAQTENDIAKAFRRAGQAAGMDMRSGAERKAAGTRAAIKGVDYLDPESINKAAAKLEEVGNLQAATELRQRAAARQETIDVENQRRFEATRDYLLREQEAGRLAKMTDAEIDDMLAQRGLAERGLELKELLGRGQLEVDKGRLALSQRAQDFEEKIQIVNQDLAQQRLDLDVDKFASDKEYKQAQMGMIEEQTRVVKAELANLTDEEQQKVLKRQGLRAMASSRESLEAVFGKDPIVDSIMNAADPTVYFDRMQEQIDKLPDSASGNATAAIQNMNHLNKLIQAGDKDGAAAFATLIGAVPDPTVAQQIQQELDSTFITNYQGDLDALNSQQRALTELKSLMTQGEDPEEMEFATNLVFGSMAIQSIAEAGELTFTGRGARFFGNLMSSGRLGKMLALRDQITGGTYLQAYQDLKGAGQITEYEGKKAADSITTLSSYVNISPKDAVNEIDFLLNQGSVAMNGMNRRYKALQGIEEEDNPSTGGSSYTYTTSGGITRDN